MKTLFDGSYNGRRVLVTGHTGFKGSWLSLWLTELGAEVAGYALPPESSDSHCNLLKLDMHSVEGDIRDREKLQKVVEDFQPEVVFHLAAQPLVRYSYREPVETFETNVMGTVNVLEACRSVSSVKAVLVITSDKCYENREWVWGYRENDPMGGYDPYSASKGATELVCSSYRHSYFNNTTFGKAHHTLLATCRAGNVIGGGDWSEDRLIPDLVRGVQANESVEIRSPNATRPWQHVLDALSGYLLLGHHLLAGQTQFADAWNFGPADTDVLRVEEMCTLFKSEWDDVKVTIASAGDGLHEASLLKLDCSKAHMQLGWKGKWSGQKAVALTAQWYRHYLETGAVISREQLKKWVNDEKSQ